MGCFFKPYEDKVKKIPKSEVFLAQVAQNAGYHTAEFGKLDIGFLTCHPLLVRHGWDDYEGYFDHARAHAFFPPFLWRNGKPFSLPGNDQPKGGRGPYSNTLITQDGWKLIGLKKKGYQLYHILNDPGEYKNIEMQYPERVKKLTPIFKAQIKSSRPDIKVSAH